MYLATQGFFAFNDKVQKQVNGVVMDLDFGSTLANFFLRHLEKEIRKFGN